MAKRYDIRTSSRRSFRRCLRKWEFQSPFGKNLESKGAESNINFWFGSGFHYALEDFFGENRFGDPRRALAAYAKAHKLAEIPAGGLDIYEKGVKMLEYMMEWLPKHNDFFQFQTAFVHTDPETGYRSLCMAEDAVEGDTPAVEVDFTLDLGIRVWVNTATEKIEAIVDTNQFFTRVSDSCRFFTSSKKFLMYKEAKADSEGKELDWITAEWEGSPIFYDFDTAYSDVTNTPSGSYVHLAPLYYHGTMDRIVYDAYGNFYVMDYKTAKGADTNKLDTDDQISAYMWAAEQEFHIPFYGFVYFQFTKEIPQPPKILAKGGLSTDKRQKTTSVLYKQAMIDIYGEVMKSPNDVIETLNYLREKEEAEGDRFIRWDVVRRTPEQIASTYNHIIAEAKAMAEPNKYCYPNPTRDCMWDCSFREACIAMDDQRHNDVEQMISCNWQVRQDGKLEHNEHTWRDRIVYPAETPTEAPTDEELGIRGHFLTEMQDRVQCDADGKPLVINLTNDAIETMFDSLSIDMEGE